MRYVTNYRRWPHTTDVIPESRAEHTALRRAFPHLPPFQWVTVVGDGAVAFAALLGNLMERTP